MQRVRECEPVYDKTNILTSMPSPDSDQPGPDSSQTIA